MSQGVIKVAAARDLGPLFTENDVGMIGQDGAYSIPIHPAETLWVFGDTFVGTLDDTGRRLVERMPNNSGLMCRSKDASTGLTDFAYVVDEHGKLRQLIPLLPDEEPEEIRIWGMDGCYLDGGIYLYYVRVRIFADKTWPFKFEMAGSGLAIADYPELVFTRIEKSGTTILWEAQEPCYGVAVLPCEEDGFVYLYGTYLKDRQHLCSLARVRREAITEVGQYEYLVSPEPVWTNDRNKAIPIMDGMPTEMSVSFNPHLGSYLAVHSWVTSGRLVGRTAPSPWGPWSKPTTLWMSRVPLRNPLVYDGPVVYAGKEHSELARENGRILYLTCVEFEEYYPRLIEVILA